MCQGSSAAPAVHKQKHVPGGHLDLSRAQNLDTACVRSDVAAAAGGGGCLCLAAVAVELHGQRVRHDWPGLWALPTSHVGRGALQAVQGLLHAVQACAAYFPGWRCMLFKFAEVTGRQAGLTMLLCAVRES